LPTTGDWEGDGDSGDGAAPTDKGVAGGARFGLAGVCWPHTMPPSLEEAPWSRDQLRSVNIQEIIQPGKVVPSGENSRPEKGADLGSSAHGELVASSSSRIDFARDIVHGVSAFLLGEG